MTETESVENSLINYRRLLKCKTCDLTFALLTLPVNIPQNDLNNHFMDDNTYIATSVMNLKPKGPIVAIEDIDVDQGSVKYRDMICVKCEQYIGIKIEELEAVPKENCNSIIDTTQSTFSDINHRGTTYSQLFEQCQVGWCLIPHSQVTVENIIKPDAIIDIRKGYGGIEPIDSSPALCSNSALWHDRDIETNTGELDINFPLWRNRLTEVCDTELVHLSYADVMECDFQTYLP